MTEAAPYLIDTTVLIDMTRRREPVRSWLDDTLRTPAVVAVSVVSIAETLAGTAPFDRVPTRRFFRSLAIWPVTEEIAVAAGIMRYDRARRGFALHTPDALIAATALTIAAVLVTSNVRHFQELGIPVLDVRA